MNITVGKMYKKDKNPVGNTSIKIDDCFVVTGIKVMQGQKGLFVAMPSRKAGDGYRDIAFPVTKEARDLISEAVLKAYNSTGQPQSDGFVSVDEDQFNSDSIPF